MSKKSPVQSAPDFGGPLSRRDLIKALAIAAAASKTVSADPVKVARARGGRSNQGKKKGWIGHGAP